MGKKRMIDLLCIGTLCGVLIWGCGKTQPEETQGASKATADTEIIPVEDLVIDVEASKEKLFAKMKEKMEIKVSEEAEAEVDSVEVNEELLGTWSVTFDYAIAIEEELTSDYDEFHEDFNMTVYLTFHDDGTFEMYIDEKELEPVLQNYLKSLAQFATDMTYEDFREGLGEYYSEEEFEEIIESQFGMSLYDYMLEQFTDIVTAEELAAEIYTSGLYIVNGNQLHMDENMVSSTTYDIFTIEGDTLTLTPPEGAEVEPTGIEGFDYPYVFTRVVE